MKGPKCSICGKEHWQRDGCDGRLQERVKVQACRPGDRAMLKTPAGKKLLAAAAKELNTPARALIGPRSEPAATGARSTRTPAATGRPVPKPNTSREGRRVLKGSGGKVTPVPSMTAGFPSKPTRSASTEKADPCTPSKASENKGQTGKARRVAPPKSGRVK